MSETSQPNPPAEPVKDSAPAPETKAVATAASDLTETLIEGMPQVTSKDSPGPIPGSPAPAETPVNVAVQVDKKGQKFDPAIHAADENGNPKTNSFGNFYSKNVGRGRKGPAEDSPKVEEPAKPVEFAGVPRVETPAPDAPPDEALGAAMMLVPTVDGIMQSVFSDGVALTDQDKQIVTPVLAAYMRSKNMKDIPPGIALAMITVAIYGPKFAKPSVKERITLIILKVRSFFAKKSTR